MRRIWMKATRQILSELFQTSIRHQRVEMLQKELKTWIGKTSTTTDGAFYANYTRYLSFRRGGLWLLWNISKASNEPEFMTSNKSLGEFIVGRFARVRIDRFCCCIYSCAEVYTDGQGSKTGWRMSEWLLIVARIPRGDSTQALQSYYSNSWFCDIKDIDKDGMGRKALPTNTVWLRSVLGALRTHTVS